MWLVNYAAHLPVPDDYVERQTSMLTSLLPNLSGSQPQQLKAPCRRLLRLLCEARPQEVCWQALCLDIAGRFTEIPWQHGHSGVAECSFWP